MQSQDVSARRRFLGQVIGGMAVAGWGGLSRPTVVSAEEAPAVSRSLITRQESPYNAEPALPKLLEHWMTDNDRFFIRSHGNVPEINATDYRLVVEGLVDRPLSLSLGEIKEKFPEVFTTATVTCAGNRRSEFRGEKKITGVQWDAGAIGTAEWRGINLADVLKHAGLKPEAKHVWFEGLDDVKEGDHTISFGGSIPVEKAMHGTRFTPGALLVHTMNHEPLSKQHGAPLRSVVPGYIGARSVKWLGKIVVSDRPSPNHFVADVYKVVKEGTSAEILAAQPIYEYVLNSAICSWSLSPDQQKVIVTGYALPTGSPENLIRQVELSADDGSTWTAARLTSAQREFCWTFWEAELPANALGKKVVVKAVDHKGATQPREMPFNVKGYQFNGWHGVILKS